MSETVATLRELSEAWALFTDLPPDATIPSSVAAVFLGVSDRTLSRMRSDGDGPPYLQYPSGDSKKRNQAVRYILSDLRAWREDQRVASTIEAAKKRGLTFQSVRNFIEPHPFFLRATMTENRLAPGLPDTESAVVLAHALLAGEADAKLWLTQPDVKLLDLGVFDAMDMAWADPAARAPFHRAYCALLSKEAGRSAARQEEAELRAEVSGAPPRARARHRPI